MKNPGNLRKGQDHQEGKTQKKGEGNRLKITP